MCVYHVSFYLYVFFFKQKTAYEMRISDWSSDVCSSDLADRGEDGGDAFDPELPVAALRSIWECPYPTVCAVNGTAAGFAVLVALGSDVIVASDRAVFVMPEIDTGTVGGICEIGLAQV